jgi:hypothetical protein
MSSSDGNKNLEWRPCPRTIANRRTDPVQIHAGHDLAEKNQIAPNRHAQARMTAALHAAIKDPIPPATYGDMMPACRIIFMDKCRIKRNACLDTTLGLHTKDRKEESLLDRQKREMLRWILRGKRCSDELYTGQCIQGTSPINLG